MMKEKEEKKAQFGWFLDEKIDTKNPENVAEEQLYSSENPDRSTSP